MFDFTHLRKITSKMEEKSFAYTVNFWQKIFNALDFDEDDTFEDYMAFSHFDLPDGADPLELFEGIILGISYSYSGDIKIEIKWSEGRKFNESRDRILKEVLLRNGFVLSRSEGNIYICNINKT